MNYSPEQISYLNAKRQLDKIGCYHAAGDTRRAMYAGLLAQVHGGEAWRYYLYLKKHCSDDKTILSVSKPLLENRAAAWDALMETAS